MNKKIVVSIILMIAFISGVTYASDSNLKYAEKLKVLGVFQGTNNGFELDREPTRIEGIIMLIKLLGKEEEAKNSNYSHPFIDVPKWANNYIGWAYENGLTTGTSKTTFGAGKIDSKSYFTFVLKALGYNDKSDFSWSQANDFAHKIGLIDSEELKLYNSKVFLRDHIAKITYDALKEKKSDGSFMCDYLVQNGAFTIDKLNSAGLVSTEYGVYDNSIFKVTKDGNNVISEFIKGSIRINNSTFYTSYNSDIHSNKILSYNAYTLFTSEEFASKVSNYYEVIKGSIFDFEESEQVGKVLLKNGLYFRDGKYQDRFEWNDGLMLYGEYVNNNFTRYDIFMAEYIEKDTFEISISKRYEQNFSQLIELAIENVINEKEDAKYISDFLIKTLSSRFPPKSESDYFYSYTNGDYYATEYFINGYYIYIEGQKDNVSVKIR